LPTSVAGAMLQKAHAVPVPNRDTRQTGLVASCKSGYYSRRMEQLAPKASG